MPTSFMDTDPSRQAYMERQGNRLIEEIETADAEKLEKLFDANALDFIERMMMGKCAGITEGQLDFLRGIRDKLEERGAL